MPLGSQIVFRLPQDLDVAVRALAGLNGWSLSNELRRAVDAHVRSEAASLNDASPAGQGERCEPTPIPAAEALGAR